MSVKIHPCIKCGACCAIFRVSFLSEQTENFSKWKVPLEHTEITKKRAVKTNQESESNSETLIYSMKGTNKKHRPKCNLLKGKIGEMATCQIYQQRPSPCRDFVASFEYGEKNIRCDEARRAHGLSALTRVDWIEFCKKDLSNLDKFL
jgi:Fe-S-cluster containining protein